MYLATGLTDVGRPEAHDEEADLTVTRMPLDDAVQMVLDGEIVNSIAVAGILAAHAMADPESLRPVDAPWVDRSTRFRSPQGRNLTTSSASRKRLIAFGVPSTTRFRVTSTTSPSSAGWPPTR